jgi:RNA:NAD 2'-phosphotransferase (TPT1/KptA family)
MIKQVRPGTNLEVESFLEKIPKNTLLRFYHGTSPLSALKIIKEQRLLPDDICQIGLAADYYTARSYSRYKAGKDGVVLLLAVKRSELGIPERIRYSSQHMPHNTR